ncbi:MAG TPA: hypothetical protein PK514_14595 [Spirochaetota bacterium]|nr:hypothetical protein [Spirochaetota bacterium]
MKRGLKYTAIFLLLLALSVTLYYHLRWPRIEKAYITSTSEKAAALKPAAAKIRPGITDESLIKLYNELKERDSSIAAIATADFYGNVKQIVKNDSLINSGVLLDRLLQSIKTGSIQGDAGEKTGVKTFTETGSGTGRFYVCSFNTDAVKFISVYVFRPGKALVIRIVLELVLVIAGCVMLTGLVSVAGSSKKSPGIGNIQDPGNIKAPVVKYHRKDAAPAGGAGKTGTYENEKAMGIDESELFASKYTKMPHMPAAGTEKINSGSLPVAQRLDRGAYDLFKKIYRELSPETVALYIRRTDERLSKSYELRGKTFLRVDAPVFESILIAGLVESAKPGIHITDNGSGIRIPLFHNEYLNGMVEVTFAESSSSLDIASIQNELNNVTLTIQEFIITDNVIIDAETGFFSASHLKTKLGEHVYSTIKHGTGFCLMAADVFGSRDIDTDQKKAMMKILFPAAKKATADRFELFIADYRIILIMDTADRDEAEKVRKSLEKEISRYRIKLPDGKLIRLKPVADYTMSYEAVDIKDILQETVDKTLRITVP